MNILNSPLFTIYLILINLAAFILFGYDKGCAMRHAWRVPEKTLLGIAVFGGSVGAIAGMKFFHHKTLHPQFKYGLPAILAVQLALFVMLFGVRVG